MHIYLHAQSAQTAPEGDGLRLGHPLGDDHAFHQHARRAEGINQAQHVLVIGDAQIPAHLVCNDVLSADGDDHLDLLAHVQQHADLAVRQKAGQHARRMIIIKQLAAQLQIEFAAVVLHAL